MDDTNLNSDSTQDENNNPQGDSSTSETQPTNNQGRSRTEGNEPILTASYVQTLEENLRAQSRQIQELNNSIQSFQKQQQSRPVAEPSVDETKAAFYSDPHGVTRRIVKEALEEAIAPLREVASSLRAGNALDGLINRVKNDRRFAPQWDAQIDAYIRETLQNVDPANLNEQSVAAIAVQAIGMKTLQLDPRFARSEEKPAAVNNNNNNNNNSGDRRPATGDIRPSSAPRPRSGGNNAPVQLNELEARLAREKGMTPEEYVHWRDMPSENVTTAKQFGAK